MANKNLFYYQKPNYQQHLKIYIKLSLQLKKQQTTFSPYRAETLE